MVHPAPRLADRARHHVHERGHVVVGHLLALLHLLDGERGAVADRGRVLLRHHALLGERVHRRPAPPGARCRACAARTRPPPSRDGCSARSRRLRMRAASTAAFFALSTPTRRHRHARAASARSPAARRARRPTEVFEVSGTPITGRSVCAATTPGSAAASPAPGDDHPQPAHARVLRVLGHRVGVAVRAHHARSRGGCRAPRAPRPPSPSPACRSSSPSRCPTCGASSTSSSSNWCSTSGLGHGHGRELLGSAHASTLSTARAAMSVRIWRPSNSIRSAAA